MNRPLSLLKPLKPLNLLNLLHLKKTVMKLGLAVSLGVLAGLGSAHATTAPTLTLEQQAKKAAVIIRAKLGSPTSVTEGNVTYLVYPLTVSETIAGDANTLPKHQDKPALFFLQGVTDLPNLQPEQDVFALLYKERLDSPIVGFNQGLYLIKDGKVSRLLPLNALNLNPPQTPVTPQPAVQPTVQPTVQPQPNATGTPSTASTATTPSAAPADPAALGDTLSDPAKFREALRSARENK